MKSICFVPIKSNSERVPGKNLRILNGKKLYEHLLEHIKEAHVFDDVVIDTNSLEIEEYAKDMGFITIERKPYLAKNTANGNDLLAYHFSLFPDYDYYFQLFVTAPFMQPKTIVNCYNILTHEAEHDSVFTATENHSFYWFEGNPVNYRPCILPRSQNLSPVIEETTGLYGISRDAYIRYRCRIGAKPYIYLVDKYESVDINTEEDLKIAEFIGKVIYNL